MIPNNDPVYKTSHNRIQRFAPFLDNIKKEKEDLKKSYRQNRDEKNSRQSFPHSGQDEMHWNTVTNKMDKNLSAEQIADRIKSIEDGEKDVKSPAHKYDIVKSFEHFMNGNDDKEVCSSCGCEDCDCISSKNQNMDNFNQEEVDYESNIDETSYMFFNNLETIHRICEELSELDESKVNQMLNDGHNWAEDHMSMAKEGISHVYNFMLNKGVSENHTNGMDSENHNYMFFANIESIHRMVSELLEFNHLEVDNLLGQGHDWAEDHISAAKENIQQVHDWLENEMM